MVSKRESLIRMRQDLEGLPRNAPGTLAFTGHFSLRASQVTVAALVLWAFMSLCSRAQAAQQHPLDLTPQEKAYLKDHPVLRMGVGVAFPPFQYVELKNGVHAFKGMAADVVHLLEQRLGVRMEPVWDITFAEALNLGKAGDIDVFPCLTQTPERSEYLSFTQPYFSYPLVIVSRNDSPFIGSVVDLQGRTVAEVKVLSTYSKFRNEYPQLSIDYVFEKDTPAMLEAVAFGRAEACVVDLAVASYLINERGLTNLKVAAPTPWKESQLAMGVPRDREILAGILQKGLDSLSFEEIDAIRQRWLGLQYSSLVNPVLFRRVLFQGGGAVALVIAVILWRNRRLHREVAERKKAEEALRASEEQFRSIVESSPMGMHFFRLDKDDRLILIAANAASDRLLKIEHAPLIGLPLEKAFPGLIGTGISDMYRQVALGELGMQIFEVPYQNDAVSGTYEVYVFKTGSRAATTLYADISDRKRLQDLMIQTEKMMSVGGLAAGMAHEINNPLSGILQNVQVVMRRLSTELPENIRIAEECGLSWDSLRCFLERRDILTSLGSIREAGSRAARIVASMLEFSRQGKTDFVAGDMNALLEKSVELCATDFNLKKKYDFKRIRMVRDFDFRLPSVPCLVTQIQQVFMNLLSNAAQAMAETPSPTLILRTAAVGEWVRIEIEDNGPGIPEEVRQHIFEPFFSTKPVGEGTGLGLSVSYFIIVNHHHGTLAVESTPGHGARFIIRLPVVPPAKDS